MAHPTFTQPEALRLADDLDVEFVQGRITNYTGRKAAAELRRLYAANIDCVGHFNALKAERDELLEALREFVQTMEGLPASDETSLRVWDTYHTARAAIAKATGGQA